MSSAQLNPDPLRNPSPLELPNLATVSKQAYKDWFGKDVQETPTVSYIWTADQFGHFGLGFIPTVVLYWAVLSVREWLNMSRPEPSWLLTICGVIVVGVWVLKEFGDLWREYRNYRRAHAMPGVAAFRFNSREILWNVVTALFYFFVGALVAVSYGFALNHAAIVFVLIQIPIVLIGVWWLRRKITFQQAGLPYLYRLANFPNTLRTISVRPDAEVLDPVMVTENFIRPYGDRPNQELPRHLIIAGPLSSGKTDMAAGVGTEFAFRLGIGRYTTFVKLLQMEDKARVLGKASIRTPPERSSEDRPAADQMEIYGGKTTDPRTQDFDDGRIVWQWDRSDLLVIDDVDEAVSYCQAPAEKPTDSVAHQAKARVAAVDTIGDILSKNYPSLMAKLQTIPRTVWVLSDKIDPNHFRNVLSLVLRVDVEAIAVIQIERIHRTPGESPPSVMPVR